MYRTRSIVTGLLPLLPGVAPEKLAIWLAKGLVQQSTGARAATAASFRLYSAAPPPPPAVAAEPFLNGSSSIYVEEMYNAWLLDPKSVHAVSTFCMCDKCASRKIAHKTFLLQLFISTTSIFCKI